MARVWRPSAPGKLFTNTPAWSVELDGESFRFGMNGHHKGSSVDELMSLQVRPGIFWATMSFSFANGQHLELDGIPNDEAQQLQRGVVAAQEIKREREQIELLLGDFDRQVQPIVRWSLSTIEDCKRQIARRGWLSHEFVQRIGNSKPALPKSVMGKPQIQQHLSTQPKGVQDAIQLWERSFDDFAQGVNQRHAAKVTEEDGTFFDQVEKSPLTQEQRNAVVCFDSRVLLVASAGSGKTSTMVAKAGYALRHGYFAPERMLLLAFNNVPPLNCVSAFEPGSRPWSCLQTRSTPRLSTPSAWRSSEPPRERSLHLLLGLRAARTWQPL